ncbi:YhcN/YlaJ family sporulation lipoprotein [Paenibacillus sp. CN-4]|uniref:YhcN/YlaJ family sporulation lipoprotein n=1 Tax=Paenibacillus nanchangensis TaxID=3348343 RepID=UPI00397B13CA
MKKSITLLLAMLLLSSCGAARNASPSPNQPAGQPAGVETRQDTGRVRPLANDGGNAANNGAGDTSDNAALRDHLEQLAARVPGVNGVNCVVLGRTAVVGIDVDSNLDRARVGTIKYTVAEALREDPNGARALVTADADLNGRLADMRRHIDEGHPVSGFASELADIIGRLIPQLPDDMGRQNERR